jgi:hypothetical protein
MLQVSYSSPATVDSLKEVLAKNDFEDATVAE